MGLSATEREGQVERFLRKTEQATPTWKGHYCSWRILATAPRGLFGTRGGRMLA